MSIIKYITIFCFLIPSLCLEGQGLKKSELIETEWCTDNSNRNFYKSDTVYLYRIIDTLNEFQKLNIQYRELDYNKEKDITKIKLKRKDRAEVSDHNVKAWTVSNRLGKWKWKYDLDKQVLTLFYAGELESSFRLIESFQDKLVWKYEDLSHSPKEDIYHLIVLKLVRIK
ncbi:MAG: hypothetical protein IPP96_17155 [Chitinophagaceae bacterium]|nr:hypothetical protein [Chitinophagaceae bacterium]